MSHPQDPRKDPLQDDEVALARVLRALPGGEPPPRVDAAILAAARDATNASPARSRRRRGLPGWALGTAAAAVLAVGIGLQLQPAREALPEGVPAQAPGPVHAPVPAPAADARPEEVDASGSRLPRRTTTGADAVPTGAKPVASPPPVASMAPPPPPPAPPSPAPAMARPAQPAPEASRDAATAARAAQQARAAESSLRAARQREEEERRHQARAAESLAEIAPVAGAPLAPAEPRAFQADDVLPPVADDSQLAPQAWLERIRERVRQGDRAGARASLQAFERRHPELDLPPDLAAFRP